MAQPVRVTHFTGRHVRGAQTPKSPNKEVKPVKTGFNSDADLRPREEAPAWKMD